jgi:hypothetical protein
VTQLTAEVICLKNGEYSRTSTLACIACCLSEKLSEMDSTSRGLPRFQLATTSRESRPVATQCTLIVATGLAPPRGLHVEDIIVNRYGELRILGDERFMQGDQSAIGDRTASNNAPH